MKYVKGFDTLRGLGSICVIIGHFGVWFDTSTPIGKFIKDVVIPDGRGAVYSFFVLSGYLITSILLNANIVNNNTNKLSTLKSYIIRRSLRIYPIYYLLLSVLFLANFPDVRQNILYFLTFTSNILIYRTYVWNAFCVTWTISIEEQFYLIWPLVILFVKDKYLSWVFMLLVIVGIVSTYITTGIQGHIAPCLVYNCFDALGIGGLYAYVKINNYHRKLFEQVLKWVACLGILIYYYWKISWFLNHPPLAMFLEKTVDSAISIWVIILIVNNKSVWVQKWILENRYLNFIGKISLSLYLFHDVYLNGCYTRLNNLFNRLTTHHPTINSKILNPHYNYWIHVIIIFAIAITSYFLIEKPVLRLKKFYTYQPPLSMA